MIFLRSVILVILWSLPTSIQAKKEEDKKSEVVKGKICIGTNGRMSVPSNREHHYRNLRDRYANCTYVDGNLELTWLQNETLDLSFLQHIREVTGYVLLSHVDVRKIVLPSLQIIRGRTLFKLSVHDGEFALMVTLSKMHNLEMPSLRDILGGSVGLFNNYNLCHVKTIDWDEIITGQGANYVYVYDFSAPERQCPPCHKSCEKGCWGEGAYNCQKFSKVNCSPQCHQGRCFGPRPRECCHLFCAGGCTGPKQSDCLACRNFYDDGVCKQECPPMQRYNSITYSWETNPEGKYAYGATCVKNCPEHLLKDNGACVRTCPPKKKDVNGECVPCDGPCPKTCAGVELVHAGNIDSFKDCTVIDGSLTFLDNSFAGFQQIYQNFTFGPRYPKMHPDKLEMFSTLKEVTGFINIQASHPDFRNLSYFRNLEVIGGRTMTDYFCSLYIVKTSLTSLNLNSLKKIRNGNVGVLENDHLCFAEQINWKKIMMFKENTPMLQSNRPQDDCFEQSQICHPQCSSDGCWGSGPNECLSCAHYKLLDTCVENCNASSGIYQSEKNICKYCHEECESTCVGPGPGNCTKCKNARDGPYCVVACPISKYNKGGECLPCHENCVDGCLGPENTIGVKGCNSCDKAVIGDDGRVEACLKKDESCPDSYYYKWVGPQELGPLGSLAGKSICRRCHPRCKNCTGYGFHVSVCHECLKYRRGEQCEEKCPRDYYTDEKNHECKKCANECRGCHGPLPTQCIACRNYRIYLDSSSANKTYFNCTASCPIEAPYKTFPEDGGDPYCDRNPRSDKFFDDEHIPAILGGVIGCVSLLCIFVAVFGYQWWQRTKSKENAIKMMTIGYGRSGFDDNEPLKPTNIKPNLAKLRIVKEAELRKGGILGYGAFGTVYKGVWVPEGENIKIPVAIKVLREGTGSNTNKEILEEAYIMASMEHPNLLQLLAVCMTSQMMLVTQLMPLGCLLDYVRNNMEKIGSKPLLNWCTQIARGMSYLEDRRLVHRDLAARNVLVQTPNWLKITDFGLAKLLDINEDEYKAAGGKMPIKWLALECIQHRIFTHKSDVWAFGVTVWEILTYGGRPYETVPAREVPDLLEKGERLLQPPICTIDVYMTMIKCWMVDAESRPSFKELADEFAKMARDPGRYLVIKGDKFMRLPSYTPQDEKDLIRGLTSCAVDGPEVIVPAEEYLQPQSRMRQQHNSLATCSNSLPASPTKPSLGMMAQNFLAPPDYNSIHSDSNNQQKRQQLSERHNSHPGREEGPQRPREGSTNSQRYCSDPVKLCGMEVGDDECFHPDPSPLYRRRDAAKIGDLRLELPVDEDDYLVPSPQTNLSAPYMDLIGDSKFNEAIDHRHLRHYIPDFVPVSHIKNVPHQGMDNPEYHLMNNSVYSYPPVSHLMPGPPSQTLVNGSFGPRVQYLPQKSSEEESDHEYYNDLERLKREKQPLQRRNETTV